MRSNSHPTGREMGTVRFGVLTLCLFLSLPLFATKGVFQGMVVEGTTREAGKYIYVAAPSGSLRRVNIQKCRVRFDASVPYGQRVHNASEALRDSAEVRVTAEQKEDGEWIASEILILKLAQVDKARLLI